MLLSSVAFCYWAQPGAFFGKFMFLTQFKGIIKKCQNAFIIAFTLINYT